MHSSEHLDFEVYDYFVAFLKKLDISLIAKKGLDSILMSSIEIVARALKEKIENNRKLVISWG